jgi:hypothetical protein
MHSGPNSKEPTAGDRLLLCLAIAGVLGDVEPPPASKARKSPRFCFAGMRQRTRAAF